MIFKLDPNKVEFPLEFYRSQGICNSIDGKAPRPATNYDDFVDELIPLGDGWYYWHGHTLYGNSRPGMPDIYIAFDK